MDSRKRMLLLVVGALLVVGILASACIVIAKVDLMGALSGSLANPAVYLPLLFVYSFLVAVILPIPIELALLWPLLQGDMTLYAEATLVMALGKAVGAWAIFHIGLRLEDSIRAWSKRFRWVERAVELLERFVAKTGYAGIFILLSIPLMSDTVVIYLYSLFNREGKAMRTWPFVLVNFLAAIARSVILLALWTLFKISLFG